MERRILLPTDFSDNSWNTIVYALKLYKEEVCVFYLLNTTTINTPTVYNVPNKLLKSMKDVAMNGLLELKDLAEKTNANANHGFEVIVDTHDLNESIEKAVIKFNIDLIIMGTKGATGTKKFLLGTNAVHLIDTISICPVLVVPEDFNFKEPKEIAFPTDFNRCYTEKELEPLKLLADLYNAIIRIVHINVEEELDGIQQYNLIVLKSYLVDYEHSFHWMPEYAKKTIEIKDFITELEINMLAMVNYKHDFMEKLIKEPVIKKIGRQPIVPFLVIPE
tara:strand:- start:330 stop:1160 length:831 start_codon:yes stop_codon:yes gene_type:complete